MVLSTTFPCRFGCLVELILLAQHSKRPFVYIINKLSIVGDIGYCSGGNCYQLTMDESHESQFQEGDKPHHIQISDAFQTYLLIPALLLLAVLGKVLDK